MEIKITLFITMLLYAAVISQSFFYMLAMSNVSKTMNATAYIQTRQLLDKNLKTSLPAVYYATLLASIALTAFCVTNPSGILFLASIISLLALVADIVLTLKGNVPLNKIINSWNECEYPADWDRYRAKWLAVYNIRQVVNLAGFIVLLAGMVFGM